MKLRSLFIFLLILPLYLWGDNSVTLGSLQVSGLVVSNLEDSMNKWSAGTGTEFGPIIERTYNVALPGNAHQHVTVRSAFSVRGNPFLELVQVDNPIGPWAPQPDPSFVPGYIGYVVKDIKEAGDMLAAAGMVEIANSGNKFTFYQGVNGIIIKLIKEDVLPSSPGDNTPQADMDFGPIVHTDVSVSLIEGVKTQLGSVLGITWNDVFFPGTPWTYYPEGVVLGDVHVAASIEEPEIELENITPGYEVFGVSPTVYNWHVAYRVPTGTIPAAMAQMEAAGFILKTSAELTGLGIVLVFYATPDGAFVEIVDALVDF